MSKPRKPAKPHNTIPAQEPSGSWDELRRHFEKVLPTDVSGIKRFSGKHRHTYLDPNAKRPSGQHPAEQTTQMISALLRESSSLSGFFKTLSEQMLELGDTPMNGFEWRHFLASLYGQSEILSKQPAEMHHPGEDRFGYKPFKSIVPDKTSGLDSAWKNVLSIPADTGLPFDKSRIKQLEQTLMGGLGIPLPLNELGIAEKWQRASIEGVESFCQFHLALQEYGGIISQFLPLAITRFDLDQDKTDSDTQPKRRAKEFYLDWLTACENAYQQITGTEQYSKAYGNLINAFVSLRKCGTGFTERMSGLMNLPTQRDIDHSHKTQHHLRKGFSDIQEQLEEVQMQRKVDEIEQAQKNQAMQSDIKQLNEQLKLLQEVVEKNKKSSDSVKDESSDRMH
jgi:hypothetical protein